MKFHYVSDLASKPIQYFAVMLFVTHVAQDVLFVLLRIKGLTLFCHQF